MAEFCKDCAEKYLGMSAAELDRAVMSDEPELCEGCGERKNVVVTLDPTLGDALRSFGREIRKLFSR